MKVTLLTSKLNFETAGGSVMDLHLKARGLTELGHDVTVITAFSIANVIKDKLPYRVIEGWTSYRGLLGVQQHAYSLLKNNEGTTDIFYVDGQIFVYAAGLYRLLGGKVPIVSFFNTRLNCMGDTSGAGNDTNVSRWKKLKKLQRFMLEHSIGVLIANKNDAFIFNTPHVQEIYRKFGYATDRSVIIEDFVDMNATIAKYGITEEFIQKRQTGKTSITLFTTGRMLKEKGFDILVRAFALLKDKDKYRVIISGGGPDKDRIEALVKELGLEKYITFPGWVEKKELANYFLSSQIFVFPKWWIEYGSALLTEALAFGLPCIIPGGGALEWLTEGKMLTFLHDSPEEIAAHIERLGNDEKLRISLSESSLKRAKTLDAGVLSHKLNTLLTDTFKAQKWLRGAKFYPASFSLRSSKKS